MVCVHDVQVTRAIRSLHQEMHQCFGAMDARVDALDARVIRAQDHCMTQMMRAMEETTRTVQRRVVRRRGDNGNVVAQPQAIEQRCHAPGGCDVRGGVESGGVGRVADVGASSSQVCGSVGLGTQYRVYICDRTMQDIWDEFEQGLNGGPSLNDMNKNMGSSWRDRCDHKNYNKLLNVYNFMRRYRQVSGGSIGDLHELLKKEPGLNTVNKLLRASRARLGAFLQKLGYGWG